MKQQVANMDLELQESGRSNRSKSPPPSAQSDLSNEGNAHGVLPSGPANGGWRTWLQVFGSFLILSSVWFVKWFPLENMALTQRRRGLLLSFGALQSFYQFHLLQDHSTSSISWIGGLQSFLLVFTGLFTGPVYDMGYRQTLLVTGGFLTVFGMMMLSLCTKYYQILLTQGVCLGLGTGIVYVPSLAIVAASFSTRRPVAIALANSGISVGEHLPALSPIRDSY